MGRITNTIGTNATQTQHGKPATLNEREASIVAATDNARQHVYTWRTTQGLRKRLESLPRSAGSINSVITKAVTRYLNDMDAWKEST